MKRIIFYIKFIEWEAVLWIIALSYLLFINPYEVQQFTLCPFHNLGIENCPGCGLGRSISFFYHFDFINSIKTHPLGLLAFIIILTRIISLTKKMVIKYQLTKRGAVCQPFTN